MAYDDWIESNELVRDEVPFRALLFALFATCPKEYLGRTRQAFPAYWNEYQYRLARPDGILPTDPVAQTGLTVVAPSTTPMDDDYPPAFIRKDESEEKG